MKKFLLVALSALLVLSMVACGEKETLSLADDENLDVELDVNVEGDFEYAANEEGTIEITRYTYTGTTPRDVTIPSEIEGRPVEGIGTDAFKSVATLKSITIPDSVTYIGDFAFFECTALSEVTLPNSVEKIGEGSFMRCTSLTKIKLSSALTEIGDYAFLDCTALAEAALPDALAEIGAGAFWRCEALGDVVLPASVEFIGMSAYIGCTSTKNITVLNADIEEIYGNVTEEDTGYEHFVDERYTKVERYAFDDTVNILVAKDSKTETTLARQGWSLSYIAE